MSDHCTLFNQLKSEKGLRCAFEPAPLRSRRAIGTCSLHDNQITLYDAKSGTISYRYIPAGGGDKDAETGRTGTKNVAEAFVFADSYLIQKVTDQLRHGIVPSTSLPWRHDEATIREAFQHIRANRGKEYEDKAWRELLRVLLLAEQIWGGDRPYLSLSDADVDKYIAVRTEEGARLPAEFSRRPNLKPCKAVTAIADLWVLSSAFEKLTKVVVGKTRERPFPIDPFASVTIPKAKKALRDKPKPERYEALMRFVDVVDPSGQLRLALVFARWLGRRIGAISALGRSHLRLTVQEMQLTLQEIARRGHDERDGEQSVEFAFEFKEGAIFFDWFTDKEAYQRLVPISRLIREEVELYLERNPHLDLNGPLFPAENDPTRSTSVVEFISGLLAAEELARRSGFEREVPRLYNSVFHGFRGLRASELENKQHRPRHVSFIVGWTCLTGRAKDDRYVGHDPRLLYAAVEGLRPVEIEEEYHQAVADTEAENERLRAQIAELTARLESMEGQNATLASMAAKLEQLLGRFSAT